MTLQFTNIFQLPALPAAPADASVVSAYGALYSACSESAFLPMEDGSKASVSYPPQMPSQWLEENAGLNSTFAKAHAHGWKIFAADEKFFLVPPDGILREILSPANYAALAATDVEQVLGMLKTSAPSTSQLDDVRHRLEALCSDIIELDDGSGRELSFAEDFLFYLASAGSALEAVSEAVRDGWLLIEAGGELFIIPPSAIVNAGGRLDDIDLISTDEIERLRKLGIIGLRSGKTSMLWTGQNAAGIYGGSIAARSSSSGGVLDIDEFQLSRWERWGSDIKPVVNIDAHAWLNNYPELKEWLQMNILYIEPTDIERLRLYLEAAESSPSIEAIEGIFHSVQGFLGEIAARPAIVARYKEILKEHPHALLAVAPQVYAGDIEEASDAIVGEIITKDGRAVLKIYSVWEVTTASSHLQATERQMDKTLYERYAKAGCHLRDENQRGITVAVELPEENTAAQVLRLDIKDTVALVLERTKLEVASRFATQFGGNQDNKRRKRVERLIEDAVARVFPISLFYERLLLMDPYLALIFRNMTQPESGTRLGSSVFAKKLGVTTGAVLYWEKYFEDICETFEWVIAKDSVHKIAITAEETRKEAFDAMLVPAMNEKWLAEKFEDGLRETDPKLATLFVNLTRPDGGVRKGISLLAAELEVTEHWVSRWEERFEGAARELGYNVAEPNDETARGIAAQRRAKALRELTEKAQQNGWTSGRFLEELEAREPPLAIIARNLTMPADCARRTPRALTADTGLLYGSVMDWENALEAVCEGLRYPIAALSEKSQRSIDGFKRKSIIYELAEKARAEKWGIETFALELGKFETALETAFRNMAGLDGQPRMSHLALGAKIGLHNSVVDNLEEWFIAVCKKLGWPEIQKLPRADLIKERLRIRREFKRLIKRAELEGLKLEEFEKALSDIDAGLGLVFKNITSPDGGSRIASKKIATKAGSNEQTLPYFEDSLDALCKKRGWPMAERTEIAQRAVTGGETRDIMSELTEQAKIGRWTAQMFLEELRKVRPKHALVFEDVTQPTGGVKKGPAVLSRDTGWIPVHVGIWIKRFQKLAAGMGWSIVGETDYERSIKIGQGRSKVFYSLLKEAREKGWTAEFLIEKVGEQDPALAAVFRDAIGQGEGRSTAELAVAMGIDSFSIIRWKRRFRKAFQID